MKKEFKGVNVLPLMAEEAIRAVRREKVDYNNLILLQCVVEKYTIQRWNYNKLTKSVAMTGPS